MCLLNIFDHFDKALKCDLSFQLELQTQPKNLLLSFIKSSLRQQDFIWMDYISAFSLHMCLSSPQKKKIKKKSYNYKQSQEETGVNFTFL